jgi:hypothetical protein
MAVNGEWWQMLKGCHEWLRTWLATTAPELQSQGDGLGLRGAPVPGAATLVPGGFLRQIARKTIDVPLEWLARRARSARLNSNCGF